jgi:3',5'-nucleoside bisphosphate phosphatase
MELKGFIDLHSHTNASDGSLTPQELVELAKRIGLDALAITDHETFAGYDAAVPFAREVDLDLVRGIELNTQLDLPRGIRRTLHLLAYFPNSSPSESFSRWVDNQQNGRRERNKALIESLRAQDVDISLEEVEARGRSLAGRPHFARILVEKGYARDHQDAFNRFIGEEAPAFVERLAPKAAEAIEAVRLGGGVPVVAHPVRLSISDANQERRAIRELADAGLSGLEVIHSDQSHELQRRYSALAEECALLPTGGSDFHGSAKPNVRLGSGIDGNVSVPREFLDRLRELK